MERYYIKDHLITDYRNKRFHKRPDCEYKRYESEEDYEDIIKKLPELKSMYNFMELFYESGLFVTVTKAYSFYDAYDDVGYSFPLRYDMFGTFAETIYDHCPKSAETGIYTGVLTKQWLGETDIDAYKNVWAATRTIFRI